MNEKLTITKLLEALKLNLHHDTIVKMCQDMRERRELSAREFKILMTIYKKN